LPLTAVLPGVTVRRVLKLGFKFGFETKDCHFTKTLVSSLQENHEQSIMPTKFYPYANEYENAKNLSGSGQWVGLKDEFRHDSK
jgi:hypothetical protein